MQLDILHMHHIYPNTRWEIFPNSSSKKWMDTASQIIYALIKDCVIKKTAMSL